ncbi:neutral zinc metallopeptidase [Nonomuraea gerenzanensis]|uniref:Similar to metalloprotease n=1 Tax=Nonomuraea gerenzanensis TaxID=93944 RepID=A0A1M4EM16_9ACTN|nr:neutral zinc metallopeptidase [Nonomuraea gerenzanensis]UBU11376.1 neutral zinc metallopeptidase [Nonomuraea gerenzanensis]SBO99858.1 similar to metalloprotease [Nonomuraea gerenzanensis]
MKLLKIAALACALVVPMTGTVAADASAFPVKNPVLTKNALYDSGPLAATTCTELPVEAWDRGKVQAYLDEVFRCLENTWEPQLKKAGLPYEPVKVRYVKRMPKKYCGSSTSDEESQAWYCDWDRTVSLQLGKSWLAYPDDLFLFNLASQMYAYHVMKLAGLYDAGEELRAGSKAENYEQSRRAYLQSDCLGAVFMQSVWPIKGRTTADWETVVRMAGGDEPGEEPWYGKRATIQSWMRAGFRTGDPGSCNTWAAPSSKVA